MHVILQLASKRICLLHSKKCWIRYLEKIIPLAITLIIQKQMMKILIRRKENLQLKLEEAPPHHYLHHHRHHLLHIIRHRIIIHQPRPHQGTRPHHHRLHHLHPLEITHHPHRTVTLLLHHPLRAQLQIIHANANSMTKPMTHEVQEAINLQINKAIVNKTSPRDLKKKVYNKLIR